MRRRVGKSDLDGSLLETLVPALIFLIFVTLAIILMINGNSTESVEECTDDEVWEQSYLEAEQNKTGVVFDSISTDIGRYNRIRLKCDEYIEESKNSKSDANIDVAAKIDEKVYVDNTKSNIVIRSGNTELKETGPIYFDNMLMIRYINERGSLKVVTGVYEEDIQEHQLQDTRVNTKDPGVIGNGDTLISNSTNLLDDTVESSQTDQIRIYRKEDLINSGTNYISKLSKPSVDKSYKTEGEYLYEVLEALKLMLLANTPDEIENAESYAIKYFTYEGKQTVFGNRADIKLSTGSEIETIYIKAGKSDSSKSYKDRVYVQLRIKVDNTEVDTYIILKLNKNYRIFDIDLV